MTYVRHLCAGLLALSTPLLLGAKAPGVGEIAPEAAIVLVDGTKHRLSEYRGHVVILNIWATWCGPCRTELPLLDTYYRMREHAGLRVFAVTTEDSLPTSRLAKLFAAMRIRRRGGSARRTTGSPRFRPITSSIAPGGCDTPAPAPSCSTI